MMTLPLGFRVSGCFGTKHPIISQGLRPCSSWIPRIPSSKLEKLWGKPSYQYASSILNWPQPISNTSEHQLAHINMRGDYYVVPPNGVCTCNPKDTAHPGAPLRIIIINNYNSARDCLAIRLGAPRFQENHRKTSTIFLRAWGGSRLKWRFSLQNWPSVPPSLQNHPHHGGF